MHLMHEDMRLQVSHLVVCTDVSELRGGLCYSTNSLGAETFKRVPSHEVVNVPWRNHGGDSFSMDLNVPTVRFTFFTVVVDDRRPPQFRRVTC